MKINQSNYEAYFLDYIEGNLDSHHERELNQFLDQNPHLKQELESFAPVTLTPEDVVYENKAALKRSANIINLHRRFYYYAAAAVIAALMIFSVARFGFEADTTTPTPSGEGIATVDSSKIQQNNQESQKQNTVEQPEGDEPKEVIKENNNNNQPKKQGDAKEPARKWQPVKLNPDAIAEGNAPEKQAEQKREQENIPQPLDTKELVNLDSNNPNPSLPDQELIPVNDVAHNNPVDQRQTSKFQNLVNVGAGLGLLPEGLATNDKKPSFPTIENVTIELPSGANKILEFIKK